MRVTKKVYPLDICPGTMVITRRAVYFDDCDKASKNNLVMVDKGQSMMVVLNMMLLPAAKESICDKYSHSPKIFFNFLWGDRRISTVCSGNHFHELFFVVTEKLDE